MKAHILVRIVGLAAAVGAALSLAAAGATPTTALAAGCYGSSCYNQDPVAMGCGSDAYTAASAVTPRGWTVEIRASKTCGAAWERIWWVDQAGSYLVIWDDDTPYQLTSSTVYYPWGQQWGNMVPFTPGITSPCGILLPTTTTHAYADNTWIKATAGYQYQRYC